MHGADLASVERARTDGRWEAAYAGQASIEVPPDLVAALAAEPNAQAMFEILASQNRYAVVYRIESAKRIDTRGHGASNSSSRCSPAARPSTHRSAPSRIERARQAMAPSSIGWLADDAAVVGALTVERANGRGTGPWTTRGCVNVPWEGDRMRQAQQRLTNRPRQCQRPRRGDQ